MLNPGNSNEELGNLFFVQTVNNPKIIVNAKAIIPYPLIKDKDTDIRKEILIINSIFFNFSFFFMNSTTLFLSSFTYIS